MTRNILLLFLLLFCWIFGGIWFYHSCCCGKGAGGVGAGSITEGLEINDGTYFTASASADNVKFDASSKIFTMSQPVRGVFANTANYLDKHPAKVLQISTPANDLLGQEAQFVATHMASQKVVPYQIEYRRTDQTNGLDYTFSCMAPLAIAAGGMNITANDNFVFESSSFDFAAPLSNELDDVLEKVANYLEEDPTRYLNIEAAFAAKEENISSFSNLGKARASKIRGLLLTKYNVNPDQVDYNGVLSDKMTLQAHPKFEQGLLIGGVEFIFSEKEAIKSSVEIADRIPKLEKDLLVNPRILYFETGKNRVIIEEEFRAYFEDVIYYLDHVPTAKIECAGHTDNVGAADMNKKLSQDRANFIANYFSRQGVATTKVKGIAFGEEKPLVPNTTALNKSKNRRVEIIIRKE